ncbi:3-hydroxybutyryl-CoA dehydrogenase [Sporobacter termitidis DSM 10068]|uniref:3-hydroxybutyryl-CoA dehydrogenase n=1 Tax=Sporobacter termitidis DSM 10068 TaxID=1123282 RepID=A0A1M5ZG50_9FIRM|nr:3-hydroxybutyryl-CoA dehydrogenase [Sporobacter termitidis]SHI23144.1 3-hydroxybutyryl-CoA dehydrogenase [Sporobacter termitidis DSM 10068]
MKKISVIGAGTMGTDIAQVFAQKGFDVVIRDITDDIISKSAAKLERSLARLVEKGKITAEDKQKLQSHISFTTDLNASADADVVIEAIIEDVKIKKDLFKQLDGLCKPETILATNTSSISITEISAAVARKDKFIGMHFFNPVPVMKLVEVIRGMATSDETFKAIMELSRVIGKEPVEVNDGPGFIVNKILVPMINEAVCVLQDGIASAEDIDKAMQLGANHPMGPLALSDLIGNDVVLHIMNILYEETGDPKYRPNILLKKMVRGGLLGKKTGRGFYTYQ